MERRTFLVSVTASGVATSSGCLSSNECGESSNHLYIENQRPNAKEVDIRVLRESDGIFNDGDWEDVFLETVEIPGEAHSIIESVYDAYGTYRTEAECQFDHTVRSDRQISEIDDCDDQVVTIGIGDEIVTILSGRPDHLSSENGSDPESPSLVR
ncbi:hypothetical protein [Natrinema sp. 1APR25-10V2]|uniref:hypothetical protein n=1 Tax=Natrinema sp. 1APR25-10V2 TaxID=2951081 RepID=UPI00287600C6|nr:hypothetical protein [Natrinema sp. 1APR25-10V2]MDS0474822.1 hypothetical protein [Natrinema sp. 1APR25-10V2]